MVQMLAGVGVPRRELVRFVAVSQPHAGDFLNSVPKQVRALPHPDVRGPCRLL